MIESEVLEPRVCLKTNQYTHGVSLTLKPDSVMTTPSTRIGGQRVLS